jgi:hypothetical protein
MRRSLPLLLTMLLLPATLAGQAFARLQVDNDAFAVGRVHDRDYTHGLELAFGRQRCTGDGCRALSLGLAHMLFTPDIVAPQAPPLDRPYVGFVGLRGTAERWSGQGAWRGDLTLGLRGPAALGSAVQRLVHQTLGFAEPSGWESQLGTAPWLGARGVVARWATIGNARLGGWTAVEAGTMRGVARFALRATMGPDGRWLMPLPIQDFRYGIGVEAGYGWHAWDNTLDGLEPGTEVPGQLAWRRWIGVDQTVHWKQWAITWAMAWHSRDFTGQRTTPTAGSVRVRYLPGLRAGRGTSR